MCQVFLNGGLERSFRDVVKVKPELPWRYSRVGVARVVGCLARETAKRE